MGEKEIGKEVVDAEDEQGEGVEEKEENNNEVADESENKEENESTDKDEVIEEEFTEETQVEVESAPNNKDEEEGEDQEEKSDKSEKENCPEEETQVIENNNNEVNGKEAKMENLEIKCYPEADKKQLRSQFQLFSRFGDKSSDGSTIKLSQSDKWFKQAGLFRARGISTTDTGILFKKISKGVPRLSFPAWCKYLNEISNSKKMDVNMIKHKLINCGPPAVSDTTKIAKSAAMDRLTDTSRVSK